MGQSMNATVAYSILEEIYALSQLRDQGASPLELEFINLIHNGSETYADAGSHRVVFTPAEVKEWLTLLLSSDDTREAE